MAQTCEKCGKKVGVFSTGLDLKEGRVLCNECASPIQDEMLSLLNNSSDLEAFNVLKNKENKNEQKSF